MKKTLFALMLGLSAAAAPVIPSSRRPFRFFFFFILLCFLFVSTEKGCQANKPTLSEKHPATPAEGFHHAARQVKAPRPHQLAMQKSISRNVGLSLTASD